MKKIIYIAILFAWVISCQPDSIQPVPNPTVLQNTFLTKTKNYVPLNLLVNGSRVVFINSNAQEKTLTIKVDKGIRNQSLSGEAYEAEYHYIYYLDSTSSIYYRPTIKLQSEYINPNNPNENALIILSTYLVYSPKILFNVDGETFFGDLQGDAEIAGKSFSNVYTNFQDPNLEPNFSKLYYTMDQGIVGFEGENGEMWAFARIEY